MKRMLAKNSKNGYLSKIMNWTVKITAKKQRSLAYEFACVLIYPKYLIKYYNAILTF